eukprot:2597646-Prymnesium_polylepis.1
MKRVTKTAWRTSTCVYAASSKKRERMRVRQRCSIQILDLLPSVMCSSLSRFSANGCPVSACFAM